VQAATTNRIQANIMLRRAINSRARSRRL